MCSDPVYTTHPPASPQVLEEIVEIQFVTPEHFIAGRKALPELSKIQPYFQRLFNILSLLGYFLSAFLLLSFAWRLT